MTTRSFEKPVVASSRLETVCWICHGLEPIETKEALTLQRLRKAQLVVPDVGVFDVTSAERINGQLVAGSYHNEDGMRETRCGNCDERR